MPCPNFPYLPLPPPLLAGLSADELSAFWQAGYDQPVRRARQLFPAQPPGYVAATRALGRIALARACALDELRAGHPRRAAAHLATCAQRYPHLPAYARWPAAAND